MSSRGHFVGQIIDDLDAIANQVKARCALGQVDLNHVLEDFFKEILNLVYKANLRNLNKHRTNEPGLDLGDWTSPRKIAFQITSQANARKVNETLRKITKDQIDTYDKFYVLIIGERRKNYALNDELTKKCKFDASSVIGIRELCREIMDLDLETIQAVHRKLTDEQRRIRIELEPEIDGKFATTVTDLIEPKPSIQRSDASILASHASTSDLFENQDEAAQALNSFVDKLQNLPRLTREFFGWLVDNTDQALGFGDNRLSVNVDYVTSKRRDNDGMYADIRLLRSWGFLDYDKEESHESGRFSLYFPGAERTNLADALTYFFHEEKLSAQSLFSTMNFTVFGPSPVLNGSTKNTKKNRK